MGDIFLITIESLRYDRFDSDRFPQCWQAFNTNFARFQNAYSNGVATPFSFPSIHTGFTASEDGSLSTDHPTIAECVDRHTWGLSTNPHLRRDRGYHRGFDFFANDHRKLSEHRSGVVEWIKRYAGHSETVTSLYRRLLGGSDRSSMHVGRSTKIISSLSSEVKKHPGFFWVHLPDTHYPFYARTIPDREFELPFSTKEIEAMNDRFIDGNPSSRDIDVLTDVYDELVRYVDRELGRFFEFLKQAGRFEDSMIVVMSDHGEGFGEPGIFSHLDGVYSHQWSADPIDALVQVPLVVKYPADKHAGAVFSHPVQNGDLLATLSGLCGWDVEQPPRTRPFTDDGTRPIVSKSNTAIRVTTASGYAVQRGQELKQFGDIDPGVLTPLDTEDLPAIETMSGDIPGLDDREQEELNERLEYLGYK